MQLVTRPVQGYASAIFGAGAAVPKPPSHFTPISKPIPKPNPWTAIVSPPAAVLEMMADDNGAVPAWPQTLTPPPSSAGQMVYGPYVSDGWLYAIVITPQRPHERRQWYELYGPIP